MKQWASFLPACLFFPCWLLIGTREDLFADAISTYYPMMIAMILGSMIAGSTPLGGGIIAFPVSVIILNFTSTEGRDFSLMIQSFGMSAASFLIFYKKQHLIAAHTDLLCEFTFFSLIGLVIGMGPVSDNLSSYVVDIIYTTVVTCLVLIFIYEDFLHSKALPKRDRASVLHLEKNEDSDRAFVAEEEEEDADDGEPSLDLATNDDSNKAGVTGEDEQEGSLKQKIVHYVCLPLFAIIGGILSSQIGSGSDIAFYFFGSVVNATSSHKISGNSLTAVSVIVMATMSVCGSVLRVTTQSDPAMAVELSVYLCLFATSPIVILGAPVGSLFLKPSFERILKLLFYTLGFLQFIVFGVLKIGDDSSAWAIISCSILFVLLIMVTHYLISFRCRGKKADVPRTSRPSLLGGTL
mmetsp:Transcript_16918/g.29848  ORF Transcript_16918/g.29848 Transcript_16918/m.29848 type:complete len:409 (+) Transcript_16918:80-1306(+)